MSTYNESNPVIRLSNCSKNSVTIVGFGVCLISLNRNNFFNSFVFDEEIIYRETKMPPVFCLTLFLLCFVHTFLLAADSEAPIKLTLTEESPIIPVTISDIDLIFAEAAKEDRDYLKSLVKFSVYLNPDKAIRILLSGNKVLFYASPQLCTDGCNNLFATKLEDGSTQQMKRTNTLDLQNIIYRSNVVKIIRSINNESITINGDEADFELLSIIDYALLWNNSLFRFCSRNYQLFEKFHMHCLDKVPGYEHSELCKSHLENVFSGICQHGNCTQDHLARLLDKIFEGKYNSSDDSSVKFLSQGLEAIAKNHIAANKSIIKEGKIKLPKYLGDWEFFRRANFNPTFLSRLESGKKITKEIDLMADVFLLRDSTTIFLEILFKAVFESGKIVEAKICIDNHVSFSIKNS